MQAAVLERWKVVPAQQYQKIFYVPLFNLALDTQSFQHRMSTSAQSAELLQGTVLGILTDFNIDQNKVLDDSSIVRLLYQCVVV